ncbi:NEDD8-conjugating protein ubc12 [Dimargaris cristalligena]|uniref:NEDD8-conjugating enzyme UBC12 n=1 Tax=Dimargaris cristalligena TaxID=215637 RepID=A0A4P9ZR18_9FUNG|nr:NEDD8-conjugating protein ubc12 [Dimargaris cristalligena]RKP35944.1 ubiquitin-conjugating enzyme/RWD-like protein [Dimargaris cristalligena]|eukprot:RKP35944.1 ubiquitin-conjugating enzyme/RWD-like protein [Dimargaris cristalligena]
MNKLWAMKRAAADAEKKKPKVSAAQIRVQKDITELSLPSTMRLDFPNPDDLMHFQLCITPDEGMYQGGCFRFSFAIDHNYPHEAPKVLCTQRIYHPNIDLDGKICLNILREDWKPVLNLEAIMVGLQFLFLAPNPDDPLNKEAAQDLRANPKDFANTVKATMRGSRYNNVIYDKVLL